MDDGDNSATKDRMSLGEGHFWIALTIFGTGLYLVKEDHIWGGILVLVGILWLIYSLRHALTAPKSWRVWIVGIAMAAASITTGYDIYQRGFASPQIVTIVGGPPTFDGISAEEKERIRSALFEASRLIDDGNRLYSKINEDINSTINNNYIGANAAVGAKTSVDTMNSDVTELVKFKEGINSWLNKWAFFDKQIKYVFGDRPFDLLSESIQAVNEYSYYFEAWYNNTTKQLNGAFILRNTYENSVTEPKILAAARWLADSNIRLKSLRDGLK